MRSFVSRLRHDARGVSAMEFALILPMLLMFSAGTIEYSRLIMVTQKLQSGAFILADLTARDQELSTEQLGHIFLAIDQVTQPFDFASSGRAIVTSIGADPDDDPIVNWQCAGSGTLDAVSELGTDAGEAVALPDDLSIVEGETIRPVRVDGDRRGYVIAVADTNLQALERAEAAARLFDVVVSP